MGTAMVTTDIGVDGVIITVGAEAVVIITDGTEAAVTVTGRLLLEGSGVITLLRLLRQASTFPTRTSALRGVAPPNEAVCRLVELGERLKAERLAREAAAPPPPKSKDSKAKGK